MFKLHIHSGLGDSLRAINDTRVVVRCLVERVKCLIIYQNRLKTAWQTNNASTFATLCNHVDFFEYTEDEEFFLTNPATLLTSREADQNLPITSLPLKDIEVALKNDSSVGSTNIVLHLQGSQAYKQIKEETVLSVIDYLSAKSSVTLHLIDHPGHYDRNVRKYGKYENVCIYKHNFPQNYRLVQLCDMLIAPDSYTKYVDTCKKMVILCSSVPYMSPVQMFAGAFKDLKNKDNVRIVGNQNDDYTELVKSIDEIPTSVVICAIEDLLKT
jgi:hypothetical protein